MEPSQDAQAVLIAYWKAEAKSQQDGVAAALRAAADRLRDAYANEEYVDSADDFIDAIASELDGIT
jgi:hypothetical protein